MIMPDLKSASLNKEHSGNLYVGFFKHDLYSTGPHIQSVYLWRQGGETYQGTFLNGSQHGFGQLTSKGERYVGYFSEGARSGMGFHEKESDIYVGWYDEDQSNDFGIFYTNGGE